MLTAKHLRVRYHRDRLTPAYIDIGAEQWREAAAHLLEIFRTLPGKTRSEYEDERRATVGDHPSQIVQQGLAKLLEDRCEFEVDSEHAPEALREQVFREASRCRSAACRSPSDRTTVASPPFDRNAILERVACAAGITPDVIERGLFADLKSEQRIVRFEDCTVEQLLHRYNVALVQALLLRATALTVLVHDETANRYRQLFRAIKFHRLICEIEPVEEKAYKLRLDGPLSLFSSTQKYGVQLANFLPHLLQCRRFDLTATLRWGAQRKEKTLALDQTQGLKSHTVDTGDYVPKELQLFAEWFRKSIDTWDLSTEAEIVALPSGIWVPDFTIVHKSTGRAVRIDVLGFWRRADADKLLRRLTAESPVPFILAVSEQLNLDAATDPSWAANVYRFKRTPLPAEIVKLAETQIAQH